MSAIGIAVIALFILILWEGSVMSRRTEDIYRKLAELEDKVDELEEND